MKITLVPIMIVWLLHGCRLEVMCNLVQIHFAMPMCLWLEKGHQNPKTVSPDEEYLKSLNSALH